jgi:hypothetical protein
MVAFQKRRITNMKTYAYGFPKLIEDRKFKKSLESFWSQKISEKQLFADLKEIERNIQNIYEKYGVVA